MNAVPFMTTSKTLRIALPLLLLLLGLSHSIKAQDDEIVRVDTDLVVLNITVTDKGGNYVPGLKQKDFKIFEDGQELDAKLITSFTVHESPFAAVILLDTSGSMESRLSLARSAAIRFLDSLRPEDVAAVYRFDFKVEAIQDFSSGRDLSPMAFGVRAKGMTSLHDAVVEASKVLSDRTELRKAIVILSDGMDTFSKSSSSKALESALAIGATIYAVDMSATDGNASRNHQTALVLKNFAEKSGGRFVATPGGPALRDAFTSIAEELGHQYTIAYRPANKARDGKWRELKVQLSNGELMARTRKGYRAPKSK